jgi:hypothetical protein
MMFAQRLGVEPDGLARQHVIPGSNPLALGHCAVCSCRYRSQWC